jgi:hypothetical protein
MLQHVMSSAKFHKDYQCFASTPVSPTFSAVV